MQIIPQPQFHHRETAASAPPMLVVLNHYRCQMASEHSPEGHSSLTQVHNPPTSREESTQSETNGN